MQNRNKCTVVLRIKKIEFFRFMTRREFKGLKARRVEQELKRSNLPKVLA